MFDESILPIYAFYDWVKYYSYTPGSGHYGTGNNFSFEWQDEFDYFNQNRWEKATHTWSANNAQFVQENAVIQGGYLILCLTDNSSSGYMGDPLSNHSITNYVDGEGLIVYPNPFNNSFALHLPIGLWQEKKLLKLYDIEGKNVLSSEVNETNDGTIKLSLQNTKLPSGIYFGCLVTDEKKLNFKLTYVR